jgi:hypothetical protein
LRTQAWKLLTAQDANLAQKVCECENVGLFQGFKHGMLLEHIRKFEKGADSFLPLNLGQKT